MHIVMRDCEFEGHLWFCWRLDPLGAYRHVTSCIEHVHWGVHLNIPLWAGHRLAGSLLAGWLGLKIGLGDWLIGGCLLGLKIEGMGLLAGVGTHMGSIGKQVPSLLHNHCATLVAASAGATSGSI